MRRISGFLLGMMVVVGTVAGEVKQISVEALFSGQVMVKVDGKRRLLKLNKVSPEGLLLISADSRQAVIEVDGKRQTYPLGAHVSTQYAQPEVITARIWRDQSGSYTTVGSINGRTVNFLVDTGASAVAMDTLDAKRLGIHYKLEGDRIYVSTANGRAPAYEITLDRVQVGEITLHQVRGFVIDGAGSGRVLLGMSFLNRVRMEDQGTVLMLHQTF